MIRHWVRTAAVICGLSGAAFGQSSGQAMTPQEMEARLNQLESQMAQMRAASQESWLNERRAEEIRQLVQEVVQDAETRASLAGGAVAGHNGQRFFLASEDGKFLLQVGGQIQVRYIFNTRQNATAVSPVEDENEGGFQMRRVKLTFDGHIGDPKVTYKIQLAANRDSGTVEQEDAFVGYTISDGLKVWAGRFMDTYSREQMMSGARSQAVDRSAVANIFAANDGYVEGIGLEWAAIPDSLKVSVTLNDGLDSGTPGGGGPGFNNRPNDFQNDATDYAVTARVDLKVAGDWAQVADVSSWSNSAGPHLFFGAAAHYEVGESGDGNVSATTAQVGPYQSFLQWTVDGLFKCHGLGILAAFHGFHVNDADTVAGAIGNTDHYGLTVQAGYMIIPDKLEPFARWEWIAVDDIVGGETDMNIITVGANYYLMRHASKFTTDVMWELEGIGAGNTLGKGLTGIGLLNDNPGDQQDQLVWRIQYQLLF